MYSGLGRCTADWLSPVTDGKIHAITQELYFDTDSDETETGSCTPDCDIPFSRKPVVSLIDRDLESSERHSSRRPITTQAWIQLFCLTECNLHGGYSDLRLHTSLKTIPRFKPGSVITCCMDYDSFREHKCSADDIKHVECSLKKTLETINGHNLGISFEYVEKGNQAAFKVAYAEYATGVSIESRWTTHSKAFTPEVHPDEYIIYIFRYSFDSEFRDSIANILSHEFAHTLGMRHWNADTMEPAKPSVELPSGGDHSRSVMGLWEHPRELCFHEDDIKWLQKFYAKKDGDTIGDYKIVDVLLE